MGLRYRAKGLKLVWVQDLPHVHSYVTPDGSFAKTPSLLLWRLEETLPKERRRFSHGSGETANRYSLENFRWSPCSTNAPWAETGRGDEGWRTALGVAHAPLSRAMPSPYSTYPMSATYAITVPVCLYIATTFHYPVKSLLLLTD